jgi:hypothetical protein
MKYLYVNGDSYADGLDDDNFRVRFKNRWSTVLAKKLELKEINESDIHNDGLVLLRKK